MPPGGLSAPERPPEGPTAPPAVRPAVRVFVAAFLGVFLFCGFAGVELWPFTAWRLFSHLRTEQLVDWWVVVVDQAGGEQPVPFAELPAGYAKWRHLAARLPPMDPGERDAICAAWASATGVAAVQVRVYRIEQSLVSPASAGRRLWFTCAP